MISEFATIVNCSKPYKTKPYGNTQQPNFINMVIEIETKLPPLELLAKFKFIEKQLGRVKTLHWAERTIDLDILFMDNIVLNGNDSICPNILTIPHPDLENRDFVLRPMMDISPEFRHPVLGKTIRQLYEELKSENKSW